MRVWFAGSWDTLDMVRNILLLMLDLLEGTYYSPAKCTMLEEALAMTLQNVMSTMCLHFSGAIAAHGSFNEIIRPISIFDINCTGNEATIWDCPHNALSTNSTCDQQQDASIRCRGMRDSLQT